MVREVPTFETDAAAEAFLDQDLSDLDFSQFKPMRQASSDAPVHVDLSLPQALLKVLDGRAEAAGVPTVAYIRDLLERAVSS